MKKYIIAFSVLTFLACGAVASAQNTSVVSASPADGYCFKNNLSLGVSVQDVLMLQRFLNQSADTRVSVSGAGSIGNESSYFGARTRAATILFQNKYRSEVLTPVGLTWGTGFIGSATRAMLNRLTGCNQNTTTPSTTQNTGGTGCNGECVTVQTPHGGETWVRGQTQLITWAPRANPTGGWYPATISVYQYTSPCTVAPCSLNVVAMMKIAENVSGGSYSWNVGSTMESVNLGPGQYIIRACSIDGPCDESNSYITIQ